MPFPDDLLVAFEEAIRLFAERLSVTEEELDALETKQRDWAFFITGVSKAELLDDVKAELETALTDGQSLEEFRGRMDDIAEKHGWKPGQNAYRQRLIYRQNLTNAYQAGRREQVRKLQEDTEGEVIILYKHGRPFVPREHHVQWDGTALPASSDLWDVYWPPNGFNCTCKAFAVSRSSIRSRGLEVREDFPETVPALPDRGFRTAPGTPESRATIRQDLLSTLDDRRRRQVLDEMQEKGIAFG